MPCARWMKASSPAVSLARKVLLSVLLFGSFPCHGYSQTLTASDVAGSYRRVGPASVVLVLSARDGLVQARLDGGGPPAINGSAPADCTAQATGQLQDRQWSALFQPVDTDNLSYSAAQARKEMRRLIIAFAAETAEVKRADTDDYCGIGIDFRGHYHRER